MMQKLSFWEEMNALGKERTPFLFFIDFERKMPQLFKLNDVDPGRLLYEFNGLSNYHQELPERKSLEFEKSPPEFDEYNAVFKRVMKELRYGNSYLLNLTFPTPIKTNLGLKEIFHHSEARYKLWQENAFVVFSPEIFVQIHDGKIHSFPMKGTINAQIPHAGKLLMENPKEIAEHATIVDLIRNDLNRVSLKVRVEKYRYLEKIKTHDKDIYQVSSKIVGKLADDYLDNLGHIMYELLPAGSICGAPKKKTVEIILENEIYERGYYTGVMGLFDGEKLDSGVMIRFIEQNGNEMIFKSGGGITVNSKAEDEYQELIDKVYVPVD
jgi:para-aminobenzoate synthetase component 1